MIPEEKINITQVTRRLERHELEDATPPATAFWGQLESGVWLRVMGQSRFWVPDPELGDEAPCYEQCMEDLITGFHGTGFQVSYLILGSRNAVQVYVGLEGTGAENLLRDSLLGTFPGIQLADHPVVNLGRELNNVGMFKYMGRLTGIPTLKSISSTASGASNGSEQSGPGARSGGGNSEQIERLPRALYGQNWGFLVRATPLDDRGVRRLLGKTLNDIGLAASQMKWQVQKMHQLTYSQVQNRQEGRSETVSGEVIDRLSEYGVELLETELARLKRARALGMWSADVHFFATEAATLGRVGALLRAIFTGDDSVPEPVRTFLCAPGKNPSGLSFSTRLHSVELATLAQLPRQEFPGYRIGDYARFDVDLPSRAESDAGEILINIGKVLDGGRPTNDWFVIKRSDFAKHGLVAGVTGSGKTNTLFYLLDKLWNRGQSGIPFLVIEPAKTEYRDLLRTRNFEGNLRVYTLGDERYAPLRLNPFEFEILDAEHRIPVQTHIDYLKSVFNAAFILYAPMPYVLEMCLHEIYEDRGWDLTTGHNRRLPETLRGKEKDYPVFPTLTDLYLKIDGVVNRLGYDIKLERDIKASLKARIGSLRLGGKGLMLDVPHSVPMQMILSRPTVLELEQIGSDDEKAFIIGLILTRLYEYRRVQARGQDKLPALQHVAVFEEAHRLLKNVNTEVGTEEANTKGQAVETFANMLSEIRAYGQGVLIAEQIPVKLTPDAIKNTNLKIMHRIVAEDDRDVLGGTMNLTEAQKRQVTALGTGQAVVYAEGADRPYYLQIVRHQGKNLSAKVKDKLIREQMRSLVTSKLYDPIPDWSRYLTEGSARDSEIRDKTLIVVDHPHFEARFNRYFLSLVEDHSQATMGYWQALRHFQRRLLPKLKKDPLKETTVAVAVMIYAVHRLFLNRGAQYSLTYDVSENLRGTLLAVLADIARHAEEGRLDQLVAKHQPELTKFQKMYKHWWLLKGPGPFAGCRACSQKCLYRHEVQLLTREKSLERRLVQAIQDPADDDVMWQRVSQAAMDAAKEVVYDLLPEAQASAAICYIAQMGPVLDFGRDSQIKLAKNVAEILSDNSST